MYRHRIADHFSTLLPNSGKLEVEGKLVMHPPSTPLRIYTIGHGNAPASKLLTLLQQVGISVLIDVRSAPYSKYNPQFNRENFQAFLLKGGIDYKYAGEYLGGRPKIPACYKNEQLPDGHADYLQLVNYPYVMTQDWYQKGIQRLLDISRSQPAVIMCSEEDPARCHRQHLIAQTLLSMGDEVLHIRSDGKIQPAWVLEKIFDKRESNQVLPDSVI